MKIGDKIYKIQFVVGDEEVKVYKSYSNVINISNKYITLSNNIKLSSVKINAHKTVVPLREDGLVLEAWATETLVDHKVEALKREALHILSTHKKQIELFANNIKIWDESRE